MSQSFLRAKSPRTLRFSTLKASRQHITHLRTSQSDKVIVSFVFWERIRISRGQHFPDPKISSINKFTTYQITLGIVSWIN